MTSSFVVSATPVQLLTPGRLKDTLLCNVGDETVYLSENSDVSPTNGIPLNVGYALRWDNDLNLWAMSTMRSVIVTQDMRGEFQQILSQDVTPMNDLETGSVTVTLAGAGPYTGSANVVFAEQYDVAPTVMLTALGNANANYALANPPTVDGFTVNVRRTDAANNTIIEWVAIP